MDQDALHHVDQRVSDSWAAFGGRVDGLFRFVFVGHFCRIVPW